VIFLFTDFGHEGPYVGQMHAVLARLAPGVPVIDLMHDAPAHDPRVAAYLLAALATDFPEGSVCCAVVDPGVGTDRPAVAAEADGRWLVGPGNGLLALVLRRARTVRRHRIAWRPARLSASFHGRDLFAPVAARIAAGTLPPEWLAETETDAEPGAAPGWPDDLAEIVYVDRFGNAMSGLRTESVAAGAVLRVNGQAVRPARVFGDAPAGAPFWYGNSCGLVEIAVPNGDAAAMLDIRTGSAVGIEKPD
jgi:S-adenosylmethionine hydrolase